MHDAQTALISFSLYMVITVSADSEITMALYNATRRPRGVSRVFIPTSSLHGDLSMTFKLTLVDRPFYRMSMASVASAFGFSEGRLGMTTIIFLQHLLSGSSIVRKAPFVLRLQATHT